jgi:NAD(P)-dependent dehydrogenase (short-subunit alcohol dehydrogenase family)
MPSSTKIIALVTGANKGIGFEVARQLAASGCTVLLGARNQALGEEATARLKGEGDDGARHPGKSDGVFREGPAMKYAFIQRNKLVWPICVQCRVLLVSVSGYHEHLAWGVDIAQRRHLSDEALLVHISAVYAENRGEYGWIFCLN